ncbi:MAG: lipocalin/fatty-acid binding family protein [Aureliella sp.]
MGHESKTTTDHKVIRKWAEKRGGKPATIAGTAHKGEDAGLLRIDFPGGAGNPPLEPITWDEFFEKFDEENLAMVYQEKKADGEESTFCKFINRE